MQTRHSTRQQVIERHLHHFVRQFEGMGARITLLAQALLQRRMRRSEKLEEGGPAHG